MSRRWRLLSNLFPGKQFPGSFARQRGEKTSSFTHPRRNGVGGGKPVGARHRAFHPPLKTALVENSERTLATNLSTTTPSRSETKSGSLVETRVQRVCATDGGRHDTIRLETSKFLPTNYHASSPLSQPDTRY